MTTKARLTTRTAPLSSEFGLDYATKLFGAEALADLPRYTRGKNTGKLKGHLAAKAFAELAFVYAVSDAAEQDDGEARMGPCPVCGVEAAPNDGLRCPACHASYAEQG